MTTPTLSEEDRREIVLYRLEKSQRAYREALGTINDGFVETAANRLYYSAYYAVTAYLIANGITVKSHSGVRTMFGLHLIKTQLLDTSYANVFHRLFSLRMTGDYEDRRNLDMQTDIIPLVKPAKNLIDNVTRLTTESIDQRNAEI